MREISLSAETLHQESTPEIRIRVQNSSAHGGYTIIPRVILKRGTKELRGARYNIFLYVWERTAAFGKLEAEIPFPEFVANTSYEARSIGDAITWLDQNGWLSVRKNGNRANIYGVAWQLLEDAGCLENLPTDGGKSPSAKIADQTSHPPKPPYKDLKSLKENTPSTPVLDTTGNGPGPEEEDGYRGYFDTQPEMPEGPAAEKLKYCGVYRRTIVKLLSEYSEEHILEVVRNFEQDMAEKHNVRDFARVLVWRIRNGVTSWDSDSWVLSVQREFDKSVNSDTGQLLGIVQYAALEQNVGVREVLSKLELGGITYDQMKKWAEVGILPHADWLDRLRERDEPGTGTLREKWAAVDAEIGL